MMKLQVNVMSRENEVGGPLDRPRECLEQGCKYGLL